MYSRGNHYGPTTAIAKPRHPEDSCLRRSVRKALQHSHPGRRHRRRNHGTRRACVRGQPAAIQHVESGAVFSPPPPSIRYLPVVSFYQQSYFRETSLPPVLPSLLLFPPQLAPQEPSPQGFSLQFWDPPQKRSNAAMVIDIMGILVGSKGGSVRVKSSRPVQRTNKDVCIAPGDICILPLFPRTWACE